MKYYEGHELEYRRRLEAGQVAWDKGEYDKFDMLPLVQRLLKEASFDSVAPSALDLGCGTGALAIYLAGHGFIVTGLDVSSVAIAKAKKQAALQNVAIEFHVADICRTKLPNESFDVITDNHFLHCIVFEEERRNTLRKICCALKTGGEYWIESMVGHPDMKPRPEWNLDSEGITWAIAGGNMDTADCVTRNGEVWFPIRRLRETAHVLACEIGDAGLKLLWQETAPPMDENDTGTFGARFRKGQ